MANPPCMSNDGNAATFLGTFLETGDTVALCDECLVPWAAAILNAMTGLDATPFLQAISEGVVDPPEGSGTEPAAAPSAVAAEPDPPSPNGKSGRTRKPSPGAGTDAALHDAETASSSTENTPAA